MDEKDKQIIETLKENSDLTTRQISKRTKIPITTVHKRINKLKEQKIIKRFTIELDYDRIDKGLGAYTLISVDLKLLKEKNKTQYDIASELKKINPVDKVDIVAGGVDLVVYLRVKDVKELDRFLLGKIQSIEGIIKTQTLIIVH